MGTDKEHWPSQLLTDLENFYTNEGLKFAGGYSIQKDMTKFKIIMYSVETYERFKKFDLEVVPLYNMLKADELQEMLNEKYFKEHKILKSALNVYDDISEEGSEQVALNTQMLIFQNLKINNPKAKIDENFLFLVVNMPKFDKKKDPAESIQLFIRENRRKKNLYLVTIIPNTRISDSLLVFLKKEDDVPAVEPFVETSNFGS